MGERLELKKKQKKLPNMKEECMTGITKGIKYNKWMEDKRWNVVNKEKYALKQSTMNDVQNHTNHWFKQI